MNNSNGVEMKNGVTVCIPVFNEFERVERAIRSSASQCERLVVSDNASTDGTAEVCMRLQEEYENMEYVRQSENIGALNNFRYLLEQVDTEFTLFLGSHDHIEGNFVQVLRDVLQEYPDTEIAAGSLIYESESKLIPENLFNTWRGGELDTPEERVTACIFDRNYLGWANYGIFRTGTLKDAFLMHDDPPYGIDINLITRVAIRGKIRVSSETRYYAWVRSKEDAENAPSYMERIVGHKRHASKRKMRDDFCNVLFGIYTSTIGISSGFRYLNARYQFMVRNGVFKAQEPDYLYYLIYIPVKLARKLDRGSRFLRRTFHRIAGSERSA